MMMHTVTLRSAQRDMGDRVIFALLPKTLHASVTNFTGAYDVTFGGVTWLRFSRCARVPHTELTCARQVAYNIN